MSVPTRRRTLDGHTEPSRPWTRTGFVLDPQLAEERAARAALEAEVAALRARPMFDDELPPEDIGGEALEVSLGLRPRPVKHRCVGCERSVDAVNEQNLCRGCAADEGRR